MLENLEVEIGLKWIKHFDRNYCYFDNSEVTTKVLSDHKEYITILPHLGIIKVSGDDAANFLQGQFTNDVNSDFGQLNSYCSRKGRVISLFYLSKINGCFYLVIARDNIDILIKQLKKYVLFSKVNFTILEHKLILSLSPITYEQLSIDKDTIQPIIKLSDQYLCTLSEKNVSLLNALKQNYAFVGDWHWHKRQMINKIPTIYPTAMGKFLPHDLELQKRNAINFEKGCFIGQEVIARMHYKAKLKYHLNIVNELGNESIVGENGLVDQLTDLNGQQIALVIQKK